MKKQIIGNAVDYPFGGAVLWLDTRNGPSPLLLWKPGPVSAVIAEEGEPVPEDRYYVRVACLPGPVRAYDPVRNDWSGPMIGKGGDLVEVYRAGQRQVRFIIWPHRYQDYIDAETESMYPDDENESMYPDDYEATFYD